MLKVLTNYRERVSSSSSTLAIRNCCYYFPNFVRLIQSPQGFIRAGGFHGVYSGLGSAAAGSTPAGRSLTWSALVNN